MWVVFMVEMINKFLSFHIELNSQGEVNETKKYKNYISYFNV